MIALLRRIRTKTLAVFRRLEGPAAWSLLIGATITFVGVISGFIATGVAKWATLLVAADLMVSGFSAVQEHEDDDDDH